jgi:hypothetical protein
MKSLSRFLIGHFAEMVGHYAIGWTLCRKGLTLLKKHNVYSILGVDADSMKFFISRQFRLDHLHLAFYNVKMKCEPNEDVT